MNLIIKAIIIIVSSLTGIQGVNIPASILKKNEYLILKSEKGAPKLTSLLQIL